MSTPHTPPRAQEPAPPSKTKEKYDEIEMAYVRPYPKDFTKVGRGWAGV